MNPTIEFEQAVYEDPDFIKVIIRFPTFFGRQKLKSALFLLTRRMFHFHLFLKLILSVFIGRTNVL